MKKILSVIIVAALTLALCMSAVGCKSTTGDTDNSSNDYADAIPGGSADVSAETLEALANSGEVSIYRFEGGGTTPSGGSLEEDEEFKKYFDSVYGGNLVYHTVVWSDWENKFISEFAAGDAPDVVYLFSQNWPRAGSRGLVYSKADLEKLGVQALDHPVIKNSAELAERNFQYNGNVFGLDVFLVTPNVMLVNDTLIKDCGIDKTPKQLYESGQWNWDSFMDIMAKVCSVDKDADGQADYRGYNGWDATYVMSANAGYLITEKDGKFQSNTTDIKVINGLQMYNDLSLNGYMRERGDFKEGKTATFVETHYNVAKKINNEGSGLGFDWSVVPYPLGPDNTEGNQVGGCEAYAIVSSTDNPQGALNLIIAKNAFEASYTELDPTYDLEYWLDDEGDQMLSDIRLKVKQKLWAGVGNIWGGQWDFWNAVRSTSSVTEVLSTYDSWLRAQCETENAYATQ